MTLTRPHRRLHLGVLAVALAMVFGHAPAGAATFVIPHWIEHSGSAASSSYVFDDYLYFRYTPGLAGTGAGPGATVDLYLYDNGAGAPLTIYGTQVCNPCTFDVGGSAPRNVVAELGQLIATRTGFATPVYVGYAVVVVRGAHPDGVTLEHDLVNSHGDPYDLDVTSFPPIRLRSEDPAYPNARVFSIPHMLDTQGSTSTATYTFDETLFATYTGGQAGTPGSGGATLSVYLFDETTGTPLMNHGVAVCAPCSYGVGGASPRKLIVRMEDVINAAGGGFDVPVKRAAGLVLVGGADPGGVTLQPWLINAHSNAFDLAMTAQVAQPVVSPGTLAVLPDDRVGQVLTLEAFPNPAPAAVRLGYELATPGDVDVAIFDVAGRQVASIYHGRSEAGRRELRWDGRDGEGRRVESGIYFARLAGADRSVLSRIVVLP